MPSHAALRFQSLRAMLWLGALAVAVRVAAVDAQAGATGETARLKAAYLADFAELEQKFTALAEAFPADKYPWRPMPGVRAVHQVLGLLASENYLSLTTAFGGKPPADVPAGKDAEQKMEAITDKAALVKHLRASFALAKQTINAWSGNPEGPISFWGEKRTLAGVFTTVMADQHEHLGQLIAYARMNRIVPPWSH